MSPALRVPTTANAPAITVVIPTRDRGDSILLPIRTLIENDYDRFEVRIVDQSESNATATSVAPFLVDPRVRYARTRSTGLSAALNEGIRAVTTEFVAVTGDDCEVQADWLAGLLAGFSTDARTGVIFGNIVPGPHDPAAGFVQGSLLKTPVLVRSVSGKYRLAGTSACMALRKTVWEALNGFDEMLGVGAPLQAGEDTDFVIRALLAGYFVHDTPQATVVHHGIVPWDQRRGLIQRNWYGTGAAFAKALKRGGPQMFAALMRLAWYWVSRPSPVAASLGDRPYRAATLAAFTRGFAAGFVIPVDCISGHFRSSGAPSPRTR